MKRKLRVHVKVHRGSAEVRLVRWRSTLHDYATVGRIDLSRDDADNALAEVRMKARDMARQLNNLERRP